MYKRYIGNTGRFVMVPDAEDEQRAARAQRPAYADETDAPVSRPRTQAATRESSGGGFKLPFKLPFELPFKLPFGLESSDLTLLLIFLFLYLQSGDEEFLILLAAIVLA